MSEPRHVTAFEDHAKRASVELPEPLAGTLPFEVDRGLDVERTDDGLAVVAESRPSGAGAVVRETDEGARLYVDRMPVYDAQLLDGEVELVVAEDALRIGSAE